MQQIEFEKDTGRSGWWGYADYYCISPHGTEVLLPYQGEPPHGDSYHRLIINTKTIKGYVWSGYFLWSECGRYFTCDWFEGLGRHRDGSPKTLRATLVVAPEEQLYRVVLNPAYHQLHTVLREQSQQYLWDILLNDSHSVWEAFC